MFVSFKNKARANELFERAKIEGKATVWMCAKNKGGVIQSINREFEGEDCLKNAINCLQQAIFGEMHTNAIGQMINYTDDYINYGRDEQSGNMGTYIYGLVSVGDDIPVGLNLNAAQIADNKLLYDKTVNNYVRIFSDQRTWEQDHNDFSYKSDTFVNMVNDFKPIPKLDKVDALINDPKCRIFKQDIKDAVKFNELIEKAEKIGMAHVCIDELFSCHDGGDHFGSAARTFHGKNCLKDAIECIQIATFNDVIPNLQKSQDEDMANNNGYTSSLMRYSNGLGVERRFGSNGNYSKYDYSQVFKQAYVIVDDTFGDDTFKYCDNKEIAKESAINSCVSLFSPSVQDSLVKSGDLTDKCIDYDKSVVDFKSSSDNVKKKVASSDKKRVDVDSIAAKADGIDGNAEDAQKGKGE